MSGLPALVAAGLKGRRRGGLIATFAVLVLAALAITVGLSVVDQGTQQVDEAARQANVAHLVVSGTQSALEQARTDTELTASSGPFGVADVVMKLAEGDEGTRLVALDNPSIEVGRPLQRAGRWLDAARNDEAVLDRSAAIDLGLQLGDTVTLVRGGHSATFTLVGTAIDLTDCGFPQCDPVRGFVSTSGLERLGGPQYALLLARLPDASLADRAAARLLATVPGVGSTESWPDTRGDFLSVDRIFGRFVTAFGVFVLVASCIVVAGSMVVRMVARRREIGLLEAVGCTSRQVTLALLVEHLAVGLIAVAIGWFLAGFLAPQLQIGVADVIGRSAPGWSLKTLAVTTSVLGLILFAATVVPAWRTGRVSISDIVRDVPPRRRARFTRRTSGLPRVLGALGVKEAAARPARSLLAALAVSLAVVTAIVASGFIDTIAEAVDSPQRVGDPWDASVSPAEGTSPAVIEAALSATPQVASWYSETDRRSTIGDEAFLSQAIGGDPAAARFEIGGGRHVARPGEAIIGYGMVNRFGLGIGDTVKFSAGDVPLTVVIVGWYRELEDTGEILQYRVEQLQAADPGTAVSAYRVTAAPGSEATALAAALTKRLGPAARVEAFEADVGALGAFGAVLRLIAVVIGFVAAANLLSVMLTSSRESARTIGVQQTLGLTPRQLVGHGAVAAASIGIVGSAVGLPLGLLVYRMMSDSVTSLIGAGPGFGRYPSIILLVSFGVTAVALAALLGALATRRLAMKPPAELVRWE